MVRGKVDGGVAAGVCQARSAVQRCAVRLLLTEWLQRCGLLVGVDRECGRLAVAAECAVGPVSTQTLPALSVQAGLQLPVTEVRVARTRRMAQRIAAELNTKAAQICTAGQGTTGAIVSQGETDRTEK